MIGTPYYRKLLKGSGYQFRQPLRVRLFHATVVALRIGGLILLSLSLPAQAHGGWW